jgi:tRNA pseudouridine55 synthase
VARGPRPRTAVDGLVVIDKPAGLTSHDVVARARRILGTRKVGHAGTLDPMATGVLLIGVERATRLLGHLALTDKSYSATIRLGATTVTDDREGDVLETRDATGVSDAEIDAAMAPLRGAISQRPSSVSAVKVDGVRSYTRVRSGEEVALPSRTVTVSRFETVSIRRSTAVPASAVADAATHGVVDVDVEVVCSSGTYVRALARDLGAALGVGGHLTALRRTRVGPFGLDLAVTLEQLETEPEVVTLADVVSTMFPRIDVDEPTVALVLHGVRIAAPDVDDADSSATVGIFGPDGTILALAERREAQLHYLIVFS